MLNLQGDVVAILNSSGVQVVGYTYDAWGRPLSTTGSMSSTLGLYNPLRYRGYVYDTETGLYYLQSRYYNPTWGRFISAAVVAYLGADGKLVSYNLFTYCGNNPVMGYDPTGHWDWGGVITGILIFLGAAAMASAGGGATYEGTVTIGALATTGAVMTYAAATDQAMVFDASWSIQTGACSYVKSGSSFLIDYANDEINAYLHTGAGMGYSSGLSYSVGMVLNYNDPEDYEGPFVNYFAGSGFGIDRCWSPDYGMANGTGALSATFSLGFGWGVGYDHYSPPILVYSWR